MNIFEINKAALSKAWSSAEQYWFSLKDYKIKDVATLSQMDRPEDLTLASYLVTIGYIPYVNVSDIEVMRAYVETISNKKLKEKLETVGDAEYVETFWKYFDVYTELSSGYNDFEDTYVLEKTKRWCSENAIKYAE